MLQERPLCPQPSQLLHRGAKAEITSPRLILKVFEARTFILPSHECDQAFGAKENIIAPLLKSADPWLTKYLYQSVSGCYDSHVCCESARTCNLKVVLFSHHFKHLPALILSLGSLYLLPSPLSSANHDCFYIHKPLMSSMLNVRSCRQSSPSVN